MLFPLIVEGRLRLGKVKGLGQGTMVVRRWRWFRCEQRRTDLTSYPFLKSSGLRCAPHALGTGNTHLRHCWWLVHFCLKMCKIKDLAAIPIFPLRTIPYDLPDTFAFLHSLFPDYSWVKLGQGELEFRNFWSFHHIDMYGKDITSRTEAWTRCHGRPLEGRRSSDWGAPQKQWHGTWARVHPSTWTLEQIHLNFVTCRWYLYHKDLPHPKLPITYCVSWEERKKEK